MNNNDNLLQKSFNELLGKEDNLKKGGEGSRGGKVIGHTKSGKPIYDIVGHENHKDFTHQDHKDAAQIHRDKMADNNKNKDEGHLYHRNMGLRDAHEDLAKQKKEKEEIKHKVIGHTKSGKPVYEDKHPRDYHDFTVGEHKEASDIHDKKGDAHLTTQHKVQASHKEDQEKERLSEDVNKSLPIDIEKALLTLEIGYLKGKVDRETLEKARSQAGVYANIPENRKLGRVGQKYKEGEDKFLEKEEYLHINSKGVENIFRFKGMMGKDYLFEVKEGDGTWQNQIISPDMMKEERSKFFSKDKIIEKLVNAGNNDEEAKNMVEKHYDYVKKIYPESSAKKLAEVIRAIY